MKKILVAGAYSLLGSGLIKTFPAKGYKLYLGHHKNHYPITKDVNIHPVTIDIRNKKTVNETLNQIKPDIVIHAAAISNVDYCENNKEETKAINIGGLKNIIDASLQYKIKIIFISSNAVFDGINVPEKGYSEKDIPSPINYYGQTKYEGEQLVQQSGLPYLIARLITMYGWQPPHSRLNPVTWELQKLKNNEKLSMVDDRFINPLYNIHAALAIWSAIEKNKEGIFHIAGKEKQSRYQWALKVAKVFGFPQSFITPVKSDYFVELVNRPKDTHFNTEKMEKELDIKPLSLLEGLELMKHEKE